MCIISNAETKDIKINLSKLNLALLVLFSKNSTKSTNKSLKTAGLKQSKQFQTHCNSNLFTHMSQKNQLLVLG